jgi:hypothetical protein
VTATYIKKYTFTQAPVAHTCHPSYSGGRDQEDHSLKPPQPNSWRDPYLEKKKKKKSQKIRAVGVVQGYRP